MYEDWIGEGPAQKWGDQLGEIMWPTIGETVWIRVLMTMCLERMKDLKDVQKGESVGCSKPGLARTHSPFYRHFL